MNKKTLKNNKNNKFLIIAKELISLVGHKNFNHVFNCMSRIRFHIIDKKLVKEDSIKQLNNIKGVNWNGQELQIIIGNDAKKIREGIDFLIDNNVNFEIKNNEINNNINKNLWQKFLAACNGIIVPILPLLIVSGMITGITAILYSTNVLQEFPGENQFITDMNLISGLMYILSNSGIALLSIFFCYSTVKYMNGDPVLGILIGVMIASRFFLSFDSSGFLSSGNGWVLFKINNYPIEIKAYTNNIIPSIGAGMLYVYIDRMFKKFIPSQIDMVFRPVLVIVIVFFLSFFFLLPILGIIEGGVKVVAQSFYDIPYGIGGLILGFLYEPINLSGMGWPIGFALEHKFYSSEGGPLVAVPIMDAVTLALLGTMIGLYFKQFKEKEKSITLASLWPMAFGVPEPALYGSLIQRQKLFWFSNATAGLVGWIMGMFKITRNKIGGYGILGSIGFGTDYVSLSIFLSSAILGIIINFLLVIFFYNEKKTEVKLVKKSTRNILNHVWIKKRKEVKRVVLKNELVEINVQIKNINTQNKEYYKEYFAYQKNANKLEKIDHKFTDKILKIKQKIAQQNNISKIEFLQKKLEALQIKNNLHEEFRVKVKTQKQVLDAKALELQKVNQDNFYKIDNILNAFLTKYEMLKHQEKLTNLLWNAVHDNLIVSEHLTKKDVAMSKADFYHTENKILLKFLPKMI